MTHTIQTIQKPLHDKTATQYAFGKPYRRIRYTFCHVGEGFYVKAYYVSTKQGTRPVTDFVSMAEFERVFSE